MAGTRTGAAAVADVAWGYANAAVAAAQFLTEYLVLFPCRLTAVKAYAATAGTGGGNTVVDVLKNGTSVWSTAANRPTLAATSTGEFTNTRPTTSALDPGDRVAIQVASISTTGHARLSVAAALERP